MMNYVRHVKSVFFKKNMLPKYIVLYVTDACNLACRHCFYYADLNNARTIKIENLEKLSKSMKNIVNISFTGGEPFVLPHLPKAVKLFHDNSGLSVASIPTNGIFEEKVLGGVETMCRESPGLTVNIGVSLDGLEKTHDYIRVKEGGYQQSKRTLKKLCDLKKKYKNLNVGVITTINKANEDDIIPLFHEIHNEIDINQFLVNFIRGDAKELNPSPSTLKKYKEVHKLIHDKILKREAKGYDIFFSGLYDAVSLRTKKTVMETLEKNAFRTQCYAGTTNCIILPDGEVRACEMRTDVEMGNLSDFDWDLPKLISSEQAQNVRSDILPSDCFCSFECQASCNTAYNPKQLAQSLLDLLRMKAGLMENHFRDGISSDIPANMKLRYRGEQGNILELDGR